MANPIFDVAGGLPIVDGRLLLSGDINLPVGDSLDGGLRKDSSGGLAVEFKGSVQGWVFFQGQDPANPTGAAGDWALLKAVWDANAYKNGIILGSGSIRCDSKQRIPSGTIMVGQPGTTIVQTLPNDADPLTAAFAASTGAVTANTTLAADVDRGSYSIILTAGVVNVGDIIRIANEGTHGNTAGLRVSTHVAVAVAGVNVNLDRAVPRKYFTNSTVQVVASVPQDILIDGGGMLMTGTGVRFCEINGGRRYRVGNIRFDTSQGIPSDILFSQDTGSYDAEYHDIQGASDGTSLAVAALESTDGCVLRRIHAESAGYGIVCYDAADSYVEDCQAYKCSTAGFAAVSDTAVVNANTHGCDDVSFTKTSALANTVGHLIVLGSTGTRLVCTTSEGGSSIGISIGGVGGDTTVVQGTTVIASSARRNVTYGVVVGTTTKRTRFFGLAFADNGANAATGTGLLLQSDFYGTDLNSSTGNGLALINATGGEIRIHGLNAIHTQNVNVIVFNGTTVAEITDSNVTAAAGANAINTLDNLFITGTKLSGAANGVVYTSNATRLGDGNDFSGCTTAVLGAGGVINRGTVQLNGATPVNVAWPNLKATDDVFVRLTTAAGVPAFECLVTQTPGVGFSVVGQAGDTSTYSWRIEG